MASTSQSHPAYQSRPYGTSALHTSTKVPDRSAATPLSFGTSAHTHNAREAARLERERLERERAQAAQQQQQQQQQVGTGGGAMAQLNDEQRDEINEAFQLFDLDKDSLIDYHEFKVSLKALGFDLPKPDLLSYLTTHGIPRPSPQYPQSQSQSHQQQNAPVHPTRLVLSLPAFQTIASQLILARDPREEILRAFNLFDTEGKGMITVEDLRRVARELNEGLEEDEIIAMIEEFDLEGKGGVGQEEFVAICMG